MNTSENDFGKLSFPDGHTEKAVALFTIYRDDREVTICETDRQTIAVVTKSWLRKNNRELVQTINAYTKETFALMAEAMVLGAEYLGLDLNAEALKLHAGESKINYEYAGRGEPSFGKETPANE
jgi:hypothetical protein